MDYRRPLLYLKLHRHRPAFPNRPLALQEKLVSISRFLQTVGIVLIALLHHIQNVRENQTVHGVGLAVKMFQLVSLVSLDHHVYPVLLFVMYSC